MSGALLCALLTNDGVEYGSYLAHIAAAQASRRLGESAEMRRWLDAAPERFRGFEWQHLDASRDESSRVIEVGRDGISALDVAGDGVRVALGTGDGGVCVWDLASGRELARMDGHVDWVANVRFDPAGERVVSASHDRKVKVWSARDGKLLLTFEKHGYPVGDACFSPDGARIASCGYERPPGAVLGTVHVWNASSGEVLETKEATPKPIAAIEYSHDGSKLGVGTWNFNGVVWDLATGGEPRMFAMPDEEKYNAVDDIAFSPDGTRVALASKDDTARVFELESGALALSLRGHANYVAALAYSPDGERIATASHDETVRLWNAKDGAAVGTLRGHTGAVHAVDFASGGAQIVSGAADGTLRVWDRGCAWYGETRLPTTSACYVTEFSPSGDLIASCSFDGRVQLFDAASLDQLASWQAHPKEKSCHALGWSPDGRTLYSGSYDKTVALWDADTLEELGRLEHPAGLYMVAISPDARWLACGMTDRNLRLWDLSTRTAKHDLPRHAAAIHDVAFSPDGALLATACEDGKLRLFDVATGGERLALDHEKSVVQACAFSPDGAHIATSAASEVRWWSVADVKEIAPATKLANTPSRLAFSPDGARVAAIGRVATLVDPSTHAKLVDFQPHPESMWDVEFSPDGRTLATAGMEGAVGILDVRPMHERLEARDAARAARSQAETLVRAEIAAGRTPRQIADAARKGGALDARERTARLAALRALAHAER